MRMINLLGQKFGRLTVMELAQRIVSHHDARWLCKCDCGNEITVRAGQLRSGNIVSCGCYKRELTSKRSAKDITGLRFGKLVAIEVADHKRGKSKRLWWKCVCDCGNITIKDGAELRNGSVKSCGCLTHLDDGEAAFNKLYYNYEGRWRLGLIGKRKFNEARLDFDITRDDFRILVKSNCFYCGKEPNSIMKADNGNFFYNGLDRTDNTKGYSLDNVVPCCGECNFYKGIKPQEEFIAWLKRISQHWKEA